MGVDLLKLAYQLFTSILHRLKQLHLKVDKLYQYSINEIECLGYSLDRIKIAALFLLDIIRKPYISHPSLKKSYNFFNKRVISFEI